MEHENGNKPAFFTLSEVIEIIEDRLPYMREEDAEEAQRTIEKLLGEIAA